MIKLDVKTSKNDELRRKTFKTTQNYESDQIIMNCIDLTSKRSKMLSYVANHSKQRQTTKVIKKQWLASIWCQNDQSNAKLQTRSNSDEFASIWRPNDQKYWVTSQTIQNRSTTKVIKLESKRSKMLSYVAEHSKPLNYKSDQIGRQNDLKWWVTSQNIQNYAKLRNDQIIMNCIDLTSKRSKMLSYVANHSKQRQTTKVIKKQWLASIWCQNDLKC